MKKKTNTTTKQAPVEPLLNLSEISKMTGLTERFLRKAKDAKSLPFYKIGSLVRYKLSDVQSWIEQRRQAG